MSDRIYALPESFDAKASEIYFHFYSTKKPTIRNKVVFSKNLICFLQQGQKQVHTPTDNTIINEQQLLLLTSGSMLMSESMPKNSLFKSILLFFSDQFLADFCMKHGIGVTGKPSDKCSLVTLPKTPFLQHFETSLQLLKTLPAENGIQSVKLEELLLYLLHQFPAKMKSFIFSALSQQPLLKLKQTVQHNIDKNLTVEEIAFLCNMSMSTFKRHFAEAFNTSPRKYFTDYKMKQARRMLGSGSRPTDIFDQLGYENLSAFSTEFKKYFGLSPRQFQLEPTAKVFEPVA